MEDLMKIFPVYKVHCTVILQIYSTYSYTAIFDLFFISPCFLSRKNGMVHAVHNSHFLVYSIESVVACFLDT